MFTEVIALTNFLYENTGKLYFPGNNIGILLIHGFTGLPSDMEYLGAYLKGKGFYVSNVLLDGHGTSYKALKTTNHMDWIKSAEKAYQELSKYCEEIFIAGLSMGGAIGLHLAQKYDIKGIISLSTPMKILRRQYCAAFLVKCLRLIERKNPPFKSLINLLQLINIVQGSLHNMDKPILIMQSYNDKTVHPSSANFIYKRVASTDKSIIFLHKSGHKITCDCEKEQVYEEIHNFITKRCNNYKGDKYNPYSESLEV